MTEPVAHSRGLAAAVAKTLIPSSSLGVWALIAVGRTISLLPQPVTSAVANLNDKGIRLYDSMSYPTYP